MSDSYSQSLYLIILVHIHIVSHHIVLSECGKNNAINHHQFHHFNRWYGYQSQSWVLYGIVLTTLFLLVDHFTGIWAVFKIPLSFHDTDWVIVIPKILGRHVSVIFTNIPICSWFKSNLNYSLTVHNPSIIPLDWLVYRDSPTWIIIIPYYNPQYIGY